MLAMLPLAVRGKTMQVKPSRKLGRSGIAFLLSFGLLWTLFVALALTVATTLATPIPHLEPDHIEGWHGKVDLDLAVRTIDLPGPKWVPAPVDITRRNDSNESGCVTVNGRRLCNNDHPGKGCQLYPSRKCPPPSGGSSGGGNNDGGNNGGGGDGNTTEVSSPGDTIATVTIQAGLRDFTASKQKISILDQHCEAYPTYRECLPNRSSGGGNCQLYPCRKCPPGSGGGNNGGGNNGGGSGGGGNNGGGSGGGGNNGGGGSGNTEVSSQDSTIAPNLRHAKHLDVGLSDVVEAALVLEDGVDAQSNEVDAVEARADQHSVTRKTLQYMAQEQGELMIRPGESNMANTDETK